MLAAVWCGLAALGSGLILCAAAAGAEPLLAIPILVAAGVEIGWGLLLLRAGRIVAPRAAVLACAVLALAAAVLLFAGVIGAIPFLALLALQWGIALAAVLRHRRARGLSLAAAPIAAPATAASAAPARPGRFVLATTVLAMLVAAITTPALAHTAPGELALPHGATHAH